jgi:hypothetical protein
MNCVMRALGREAEVRSVGVVTGDTPLVYDCAQVHEMNCVMRALGREAEVRSVGVVTGDTPPSII